MGVRFIKDWKNPVRDTEEYRNSILEILSDARVVAPVIQMADFHSSIRQRSYFYVFSHQTTNGDYPQVIPKLNLSFPTSSVSFNWKCESDDGWLHFYRCYHVELG